MDNGGEYTSARFEELLKCEGIHQNARTERSCRTDESNTCGDGAFDAE